MNMADLSKYCINVQYLVFAANPLKRRGLVFAAAKRRDYAETSEKTRGAGRKVAPDLFLIGSTLIVFLDRFIAPSLKLDSEQFYRARVLAFIALAYVPILVAVALYLLTLAPVPLSYGLGAAAYITILDALCASALIMLKTRGRYELCTHLVCGVVMGAVTAGIIVTGGPVLSPTVPVSLVAIILAFILGGRRMGMIWTWIVLAMHSLLLVLGVVLGPFPQWLNLEYPAVYHIVHWLVMYTAIMGMMIIFDAINARLKRERDAERERFAHLASHDSLTQLANRLMFDDNLRLAVARTQRHRHSLALFFIDLDGFKPINDTYGHEMGDRVLQVVAARLQTHFRNIDTVARLGGDEFAIVVEDLDDESHVVQLAQKIVSLLSDPMESLPPEIKLGGSIGVALYPQHAQDAEKLVRYADTAMYQAKRSRDSYRIFDASML